MASGVAPSSAPSRDVWQNMFEDLVPLSTQLVTPALAEAFEIPTAKASVPVSQLGQHATPGASGQTKSSYQVDARHKKSMSCCIQEAELLLRSPRWVGTSYRVPALSWAPTSSLKLSFVRKASFHRCPCIMSVQIWEEHTSHCPATTPSLGRLRRPCLMAHGSSMQLYLEACKACRSPVYLRVATMSCLMTQPTQVCSLK